jgi:hypothetical protein
VRYRVFSQAATPTIDLASLLRNAHRYFEAEVDVLGANGTVRLPTVWLIDAEPPESPAATLNLCALLASTALGPVLPEDASTLFGVRGAMQRLEGLLGESSLMR